MYLLCRDTYYFQSCGKRKRQLLDDGELAKMEELMRALLVLIANASVKNENIPLWSTRDERSRDLCPASMGMIIDPESSEVLAASEFACPQQEALNGNSHFCDAPSREFHPLGAVLFLFLPRREFNPFIISLYF